MSEVAALVLAAGQGTRFGEEPKLLASFRGTSLVRRVAQAALGSCAAPVIVVTGHRADEIEAALADLAVEFARNPSYGEGLSTSLKAGFRVKEIPIVFEDRRVGQSKLSQKIFLEALTMVWKLRLTV